MVAQGDAAEEATDQASDVGLPFRVAGEDQVQTGHRVGQDQQEADVQGKLLVVEDPTRQAVAEPAPDHSARPSGRQASGPEDPPVEIAGDHDHDGHDGELAQSLVGGEVAKEEDKDGVPLEVPPRQVHEARGGHRGQTLEAAWPESEFVDETVVIRAIHDLDDQADGEKDDRNDHCLLCTR